MNKIIITKNISENLIREYPNFLFVYGNLYRGHIGVFANACGISIKKGRGSDKNSWWQKNEIEKFKERIDNEFIVIHNHLEKGAIVVFPKKSLGDDNQSRLLKYNPEMFAYLQRKIESVCDKYGINENFTL